MATRRPVAILNDGSYGEMPSGDTLPSSSLPASGVSADTYGSIAQFLNFTIDTYGRITAAAGLPFVASSPLQLVKGTGTTGYVLSIVSTGIPVANISGLATSATTDTTNASNISSGTLAAARLPSGISAKNKLVNGSFQIWQTGTASSSTGYLADQWYGAVVGGTVSFSQTALNASGCQYGLTWTTGAASSYGAILQALEQAEVIPLRGKTITFSIYVLVSSGFTGNMSIYCRYSTTTDALGSQNTQVGADVAFTPTTTLARYTQTVTVPADAIGLRFGVTASNAQASGVAVTHAMAQLEIGNTATPFDSYPYVLELQRCQRYLTQAESLLGCFNGVGTFTAFMQTPVALRTTPSISYSGTISAIQLGVATYNSITAPSSISYWGNSLEFSIAGFGSTPASGVGGLFNQVLNLSARL